jgi:hypothetical protein
LKFKYYLRGLSLGIIITTIILTISVRLQGGIMTDDRVIDRALELGMVIPEDDSASQSEQNTENFSPLESDTESQPELSTESDQ